MRRLRPLTLVAAGLLLFGSQSAAAQPAPARLPQELRARVPEAPTGLDQQRADETREELRRVLDLYPPALGRVLKLDPSLMTNAAYLTPYPALATYFQRHPEVPRYPSYFLSFVYEPNNYEPRDPASQSRAEAMRMWREVITGIMVFAGFMVAILTVTWLIRHFVHHRRWLRATKIQSDVHGKLMERFSTNDELLAYVQSPAGQKFLQAGPLMVEPVSSPGVSAPISRILWSVQAGLVLVCGGFGMLVIKQYLIEEVAEMLLVFGVLGISVGVGFALAAGASYILSQRLGLLESNRTGGTTGV